MSEEIKENLFHKMPMFALVSAQLDKIYIF